MQRNAKGCGSCKVLRYRKRRCARRDGLRAPASPLACSTRSSGIATATLSRPLHRARHVRRYWAGPHRDRRAGDSRHASKGRAASRRPEPGRGGAARVDRLGQSQDLDGHQAGAALGGKQRRPHGAQVHHMPAMHVNNEFGTLGDAFPNFFCCSPVARRSASDSRRNCGRSASVDAGTKPRHGRPHMYMQCPLMRPAYQFSSYMTFFDIKFSRPPPIRYVKRFLLARVLYLCVSKRFARRS